MSLNIIESHIVKNLSSKMRVSDYGGIHMITTPSRKSLKKAIKSNRILLNGTPAHSADYIQNDDLIEVLAIEIKTAEYPIKISVSYEDDHLAMVNKPAGILTSGNQHKTLQNALTYNLAPSKAIDALHLPLPVHRLDRAASGLLVIAKSISAQRILYQMIGNHSIHKIYRVITHGLMPNSGDISTPLDDKTAHTSYRLLRHIPSKKYGGFSITDVEIVEGRKNQIRRHLHSIGHTILGDSLYPKPHPGQGLYLTCRHISMVHPITDEELSVTLELHSKFEKFPY